MTDLLLPIIIILVMFILIDYFETWIPLMIVGFLFLPIAWLFSYQLRDCLYSELFGADISMYLADISGITVMLSLIMFFIPLTSFFKMYYITRMIKTNPGDHTDG